MSPYLTSTKTVSLVLDAVGFDDPVTDIAKTSFFFPLRTYHKVFHWPVLVLASGSIPFERLCNIESVGLLGAKYSDP